MITRNELKYYSSLNQKKIRRSENKFLVEGKKIVFEGINANYSCEIVIITNNFLIDNSDLMDLVKRRHIRTEVVKNQEFEKITDTKSPQGIVAVFENREKILDPDKLVKENIIIFLDNISDPGNAGTILRTCDWFGIRSILLSSNSAEYLNPKVIRSSMGSVFHLNIFEKSDVHLRAFKEKGFIILSSDLKGEDIFKFKKPEKCVLVLSNESAGPSPDIIALADRKITVPGKGKAESLNVSSAAAIIISQLTSTN